MVIVIGNGFSDMNSNPGRNYWCSHCADTLGKGKNLSIFPMSKILRQTGLFGLSMDAVLGEGKLWIQAYKTPLKN